MEPRKKKIASTNLSKIFSKSPLLSEPMQNLQANVLVPTCCLQPRMLPAPSAHTGMRRFTLQLIKSTSLHGVPHGCPGLRWMLLSFGRMSGKVAKSGCKPIPAGDSGRVRPWAGPVENGAVEISTICLVQSPATRQDQLCLHLSRDVHQVSSSP